MKLSRGLPVTLRYTLKNPDGTNYPAANKAYFTVKTKPYDFDRADAHAIIIKETTIENGVFSFTLTAEELDQTPRIYYYDVIADGVRYITDSLIITGGATNRHVMDDFPTIPVHDIEIIVHPRHVNVFHYPFFSELYDRIERIEQRLSEIDPKHPRYP